MYTNNTLNIFLYLVLLSLFSCQKEQLPKTYLFLGHTYDWMNLEHLDPRLERLDYEAFDQIWLGGDISAKTTEKPSTLDYLDSIFDLSSTNTHWALGNHDIMFGNLEWITEHTSKPFYYTAWVDGICLLVLNTNLFWIYESNPSQEFCEEKEAQLQLIKNVTDTLSKASHLVVLHHFGLFNRLKVDSCGLVYEDFNLNNMAMRATCDSASYLEEVIYPDLVSVQKRGIQVVAVGGDFGMRSKAFEFCTDEGIWLLGSGINNSVDPRHVPEYITCFDPDKVLVFEHQPGKGQLDWRFIRLNELLEKQSLIQK